MQAFLEALALARAFFGPRDPLRVIAEVTGLHTLVLGCGTSEFKGSMFTLHLPHISMFSSINQD